MTSGPSSFAKYFDGTIKLTHSAYFPDSDDVHIKFSEIVQKDHLKQAIFTAMCYDPAWFVQELPADVPIIFYVDYDKKSVAKTTNVSEHWTFAYPPFPHYMKYGTMHAKVMLLEFTDCVRVAISSANLVPFDYNEVENIIFIQDFPLQKKTAPINTMQSNFVAQMRLLFSKFPKFDFSCNK